MGHSQNKKAPHWWGIVLQLLSIVIIAAILPGSDCSCDEEAIMDEGSSSDRDEAVLACREVYPNGSDECIEECADQVEDCLAPEGGECADDCASDAPAEACGSCLLECARNADLTKCTSDEEPLSVDDALLIFEHAASGDLNKCQNDGTSKTDHSSKDVPPKSPNPSERISSCGNFATTITPAQADELWDKFPCSGEKNTGARKATVFYVTTQGTKSLDDMKDGPYSYQIALACDVDGLEPNNYPPSSDYPNDFFGGTDHWYQYTFDHRSDQADFFVSEVDNSGTPQRRNEPNGFACHADDGLVLVLFDDDLDNPECSCRTSQFGHGGDYGIPSPHDWSGDVEPPVGEPTFFITVE